MDTDEWIRETSRRELDWKKKIEKRRENWWIDSPSSESKRRNDNHDGVTIKSDRIKNWGASFGGPEITKKEKKEERKKIKENKKKPNPPTDLFVIRKKKRNIRRKGETVNAWRKCKVDLLFDLLTRNIDPDFHDFYESWFPPHLEVTRRGECKMDLEKATILFLLIELEKRKDREATRGTRTGRVEFVQPRRKYWAAKRKGTSFNPISQLEFRIKRSAGARNRLATAERNVSFYKPWREIDFDRAAQNWGWERFESKRKSIYRKFFIVLSYSVSRIPRI